MATSFPLERGDAEPAGSLTLLKKAITPPEKDLTWEETSPNITLSPRMTVMSSPSAKSSARDKESLSYPPRAASPLIRGRALRCLRDPFVAVKCGPRTYGRCPLVDAVRGARGPGSGPGSAVSVAIDLGARRIASGAGGAPRRASTRGPTRRAPSGPGSAPRSPPAAGSQTHRVSPPWARRT